MIETYKVEVTTTGEDASAVGSGYTERPIRGKLIDIYLDYAGTAPNTTDVVITDEEIGHTLLSAANNATDGLYSPRTKPVDSANAAITNAHDKFSVNGLIKIAVAGSNALDPCVTAYIRVEED